MVAEVIADQVAMNNGLLFVHIGRDLFLLEIDEPFEFILSAHSLIVHDIPWAPMPFSIGDVDESGVVYFGHIEVDSDNKKLQEKLRKVRSEALAWGYQEGSSWWV